MADVDLSELKEPIAPAPAASPGADAANMPRDAEPPRTVIDAADRSLAAQSVVIKGNFNFNAGSHQANESSPTRRKRAWKDPSKICVLPAPLADIDAAQLLAAAQEFTERHVLIVDCIDSETRLAAAARVIRETVPSLPARSGAVHGGTEESFPDDARRSDAASQPGDGAWTEADVRHVKLGESGPLVLILELHGARGQAFLDGLLKSPLLFDQYCASLRDLRRYLILLPHGPVRSLLGAGHASRGFRVRTLRVDFLVPWLRHHYPDEVEACSAAIRELAQRGEWNNSEELLYEWLWGIEQRAPGQRLLDRIDAGRDSTKVTTTLDQALACSDGSSEPLLAALFVASHLPGLAEHDFYRAVESLLSGRTRRKPAPIPTGADKSEAAASEVEVALVEEWRDGLRSIMRGAELEVRPGSGGPRTIAFRDLRSASRVHAELVATPMFSAQQLERLLAAGFLFHPKEALSRGTAELVARAVLSEPGTYDEAWLFEQLQPVLAPAESTPHELQRWRMECAQLLLRSLQSAHGDARPASDAEAGRARSIVDQLFERTLRVEHPHAALFVPDLALRLRHGPGFDAGHWFRQVLARGKADARARALRLLAQVPWRQEPDCFADLDLLLSWLEGARDGSQARDGAATIFGAWCVSCIHFAYARYDAKAVAVVDFLLRVTAARPDAPKRLAAALLSADVLEVLTDLQEPLSEALRLILPKQAWQTDVTRWSDEWSHGLAPAWNAAVARHIEKPRISEPQRYFVPALVLVAWCDVFEESPAVLEQLAAELLATEGELEREIRAWFDVLIEVMTISAKHIAGLESLSRPDRAKLFGPASARSKPIKSFRSRLTRRAPPVEADP